MTPPRFSHPSPAPAWFGSSSCTEGELAHDGLGKSSLRGPKNAKEKRDRAPVNCSASRQAPKLLSPAQVQPPEGLTPSAEGAREWVLPPLQRPRPVASPASRARTVVSKGPPRLLSAGLLGPNCDGELLIAVIFRAEILTGTNNQ